MLGDGSRVRRPPAVRRGAAPARHRRRAEVRRVAARRALPDAQRRRADRPRPRRADRAARAHGRARDARAVPVEDPSAYGLVRHDGRRHGDGVRREAVGRPDRHPQHLGRRLRARARRARPPGARTSPRRSSATSSRGSSATACSATSASGYWLDIGTPERYLQATFDILEGTVRTRGHASAWAAGSSAVAGDVVERRAASSRRRWSRPAAGSGAARGSAAVSCWRRA